MSFVYKILSFVTSFYIGFLSKVLWMEIRGIIGILMDGWSRVDLIIPYPIQGQGTLRAPSPSRSNIAHLPYARVKLTPFSVTEELGTDHEQTLPLTH